MTTPGPLPQEVVGRVLEDHQRVQRERAELVAIFDRLAPAWRGLRAVLNELNRFWNPDAPDRQPPVDLAGAGS